MTERRRKKKRKRKPKTKPRLTAWVIRATSVTLLDKAGIPVHRIMQGSGHRNEGSVKVYCERQTLQQQKQCS